MGFDSRFYAAAETETNLLRQRNSRLLASREAEIEGKFPEIAMINKKLGATVAQIVALIGERPDNFEARMNEIQQNNLFLQEQLKSELSKKGYPEDYLSPVYSCKICKDTGIDGDRRCACFMERVKRAAAEELNRSSPMKLCSFSDFKLEYYDDSTVTILGCTAREAMSENFSVCRRYAENFHLPCDSILMHGKTGLGKTHLSLSIASEVLSKGYSVIYGSAPDLFRKIEKEHFGQEEGDTIGALQSAELLILDDLGAEFESRFYVSVFYNILNNRMNAARPIIVSTNLELPELQARYGDRITSRLMTMENLIFVGSDVRVRKNR